ncbi:WD repeat-containing protein 20 [Aphelenchoides avenae]|nr:WD repeat-containing protein 20 [Aphelenchus avenae]
MPLNQGGNALTNSPVRVSFLTVPAGVASTSNENDKPVPPIANGESPAHVVPPTDYVERICFNCGRELFVYDYGSVHSASDLSKPIDKRVYKGTYPTCHDFNQDTATLTSCSLLVGFSAGQIQLIDPFQKEFQSSRLFNEERTVDKSAVTCLKWIRDQPSMFIASHSSGALYVYNEELECPPNPPVFQQLKQGPAFTIFTCKSKSPRNPVQKWTVGKGGINQFEFSPDSKFLAIVGQDGFLRVFDYQNMEIVGYMKSYFGGLLCLAWSPDMKYIVTGGEDDLLTIYSVTEKRVLCRGQGHKSWISQVAFDPFTSTVGGSGSTTGSFGYDIISVKENAGSAFTPTVISCEGAIYRNGKVPTFRTSASSCIPSTSSGIMSHSSQNAAECITHIADGIDQCISYRIGSVGHDTQLCLWDLSEDIVGRTTSFVHAGGASSSNRSQNVTVITVGAVNAQGDAISPNSTGSADTNADGAKSKEAKGKLKKFHKRGLSFGSKFANHDRWSRSNGQIAGGGASGTLSKAEELTAERVLGSPQCPRMDEVRLIEPLVCKKISHERLTVLHFREDCLVTACQEGFICTWARPGHAPRRSINSPSPSVNNNAVASSTSV